MKTIKYILFIFLSVSLLNSCEDFLEPQSQSEFMPETAEQLNTMLLGEGYSAPNTSDDMICFIAVPLKSKNVL